MKDKVLYGSLFEDDYLIRSLGTIVSQPDIALTELVANAWDAGATEVKIFIPDQTGERLVIEDNGIGMTLNEFQERWMKLRYNRIKHQGRKVIFPDANDSIRYAYGRNGVGRHGLLCFGGEYYITTIKDGKRLNLTVTTRLKDNPIAVTDIKEDFSDGHSTRLEVVVEQNLPKVEKIRDIISARFLHDPQFKIEINRTALELGDLKGLLDTTELIVVGEDNNAITLTANFIDSQKASKKSIYQGIAFWQSRRLVGEPSWNLGKDMILDGRTSLAKRYTVIISTEDLSDYIKEDWSGFKDCSVINRVYKTVAEYVDNKLESIALSSIEETKQAIKLELKDKLKDATPLMLYEIDEAIANMAIVSPKAKHESISLAVEAIINLERTKGGQELLKKLTILSDDDIEGLNALLSRWTVKDALIVLDEIDRRLSIIEAIRKLSKDSTIDELHILHPMVTEARWLFGPEYDSAEYISNRQIQTVVSEIFKNQVIQCNDINYKKRPDIVCLSESTISITGIEEFASDSELSIVTKILVIELKRGGFKLTRKERDQANGYLEDIIASNIGNKAVINAYVVGDSIADNIQPKMTVGDNEMGKLFVTTYSQLVDTAEKRLFGLRNKLSSMYDDIPGMELYRQGTFNFKE